MTVFEELARHATLPFEQGRMLPLEAYRSAEVLEVELDRIFGHDWLCVGRTHDVRTTGDYLTADLPTSTDGAVRSVIVVRGDDGLLRAFDNVCVHRGARLLDGCGTESRITCPYHAWTFRLDGSLVGAPHMTGSVEADGRPFDAGAHHLVDLRIEEWEGFVFVTQDGEAEPLAPQLVGLQDVVGRYGMEHYVTVHRQADVWDTNWKLLVENFLDAYHVFKVHKESFGASGDSIADTTMFPGTERWAHHRVVEPGAGELAAADNERLVGEWRKTIVLAAVFPGLVMQLQPDWMWSLRITPSGTGRVSVCWEVAMAPESLAAQDSPERYVAELLALIHQVNSEDKPIVEGLRANVDRPQMPRGPLSYLERNTYDFDRYVAGVVGRGPR